MLIKLRCDDIRILFKKNVCKYQNKSIINPRRESYSSQTPQSLYKNVGSDHCVININTLNYGILRRSSSRQNIQCFQNCFQYKIPPNISYCQACGFTISTIIQLFHPYLFCANFITNSTSATCKFIQSWLFVRPKVKKVCL